MRATLFGVPASHPTLAAELMLRHKGIDYRRVDLVNAAHRTVLRAMGFPRKTVPAMRLEGAKVQGSSEIARALDGHPDPDREPHRRADRGRGTALQRRDRRGGAPRPRGAARTRRPSR